MDATRDREDIVTFEQAENVTVVHFTGRVREHADVLGAMETVVRFADETPGSSLLLNMKQLEYLSNAGLGNLVGLLKKVRRTDGALKLCCVQSSVREVFEAMRLDRIFELFDDQEVALKSF